MSDGPPVHSLTIPIHVDYTVVQPPNPSSPGVFTLALHGWGQTCRSFARRMAPLAEQGITVAVPQAPHPVYVSMEPKKVGFSWLTMYERDRAVAEFAEYMARLLAVLDADHCLGTSKPFLLGFSQGVSMAHRLAVSGRVRPAGVVACAADLPPDVAEKLSQHAPYPVLLVHAIDDPMIPIAKAEEAETILREHDFPVDILRYEGGHVLPPEIVSRIGEWLHGHASQP